MRRPKTIAGIVLFLLLILLAYVALDRFLEQKAIDRIESEFEAIQIDFADLNLSVLGRSLTLDSLSLRDSGRLVDVQIPSLKLGGIRWFKTMGSGKLEAGILHIPSLKFRMYSRPSKIVPVRTKGTFYGRINRLRLDSISGIASWNGHPDSVQRWTLDHFALDLKSDRKGRFGARGKIFINGLHWKAPKNLYSFHCDTVEGDLTGKWLSLKNFRSEPLHSKNEFARTFGNRIGRIQLSVPEITCHGFRFDSLFSSGGVLIDRMAVSNIRCSVYENQSFEPDYDRIRTLPHLALRKMGIPLSLDTLQVKMNHFKYGTTHPLTGETGSISFERTYLSAYHISNMRSKTDQQAEIEVDIRSAFEGRAPFSLRYVFSKEHSGFYCRGRLGRYDLKWSNPILMPIAFLDVRTGICRDLSFEISSDRKSAEGEVRFSYEDLEVQVLKPDLGKGQNFLSFLANSFLIRSDNLKGQKNFRTGRFTMDRPVYKSFWGYQWLCLKRGLIRTILPPIVAERAIE